MGAKIDMAEIEREIFASRDYKIKSKEVATRYMDNILYSRKRTLLNDFNSSKVTSEIESGPDAQNTSGLLGGIQNLFTFIGFNRGSQPTENLRKLLHDINYLPPSYNSNGSWTFIIPLPTDEEIIAATPIEWHHGAGWAFEIERGMSGLGHYLRKESPLSRSGGGLQTDKVVRTAEAARTPYITAMLEDFRVNLTRIRY